MELQPFIFIPQSDDTSSELDLDVDVSGVSASVADGTGRIVTVDVPAVKYVTQRFFFLFFFGVFLEISFSVSLNKFLLLYVSVCM